MTQVISFKRIVSALVFLTALAGCGFEAGAGRATSSRTGALPGPVGDQELPPLNTVRGSTRNAIAWAPLADPDDVTVEGSVPSSRAWSTSKVLVIAAYLDEVVDGDPTKVPADARQAIHAALTRSDEPSIDVIRRQLPNWQVAMTRILRAIGDRLTTVPPAYEGTMQWSVREQVRFMAALGNGQVVTPDASAFLLREMKPVPAQRWGLGTIGARAFKPGWNNARTESRQMGIVGDFAVAIVTSGGGDGDSAHVAQQNRLAELVAKRLDDARCLRLDLFSWHTRWCPGW